MSYPSHLRMGNAAEGSYVLMCTHCGATYVPSLPISIDMMSKIVKQFGSEHRRCKAPESGPISDALLLATALPPSRR